MNSASGFKPLQDRVTSSLLDVTRTAGVISAEDLSFHRSSNAAFSRSLDSQNSRLLQLTQKLLQAATRTGSNISPPRVQNGEELDDNWHGLVDVVDDLLEHADGCLDEYTGVIKRISPVAQDNAIRPTAAKNSKSRQPSSIFSTSQMAKPQLLFEKAHTNHETEPFKPLLRAKPHSIVDLQASIGEGRDGYNHPYAAEIETFSYPESIHSIAEPIPCTALIEQEAIFVNTKEGVEEMLKELRSAREIAIDLEHHDMHSYTGIVCLMQISTRQRDWIIDTLVPWREDLEILNEVFADPKILKVLQGSKMDVVWMQRDLGLYLVGLFDTYHASTALGFPQKSLKYLLERFCDFHADKKHQLADWRIRPIPGEMFDYARSDTHYLLFIYDQLRNMLLESSTEDNDLINYVLVASKKEALQRFERPIYDAEKGLGPVGWLAPLARRSIHLTAEQLGVYRAVHEWRDTTARALDEGTMFVMSQNALFAVAEAMPTTVPALIRVTNPVSKAVKEASRELVGIVKQGKDAGRGGPTVAEVLRANDALKSMGKNAERLSEQGEKLNGVAATIEKLNSDGEGGSYAARTLTSRFWGGVEKQLTRSASRFVTSLTDALHLLLPLPALGAASYTMPANANSSNQAAQLSLQASPPMNSSPAEEASPDIFVLKDLDRGAKRKAVEANLEGSGPSSMPESKLVTVADKSRLAKSEADALVDRSEARATPKSIKRQKQAVRGIEPEPDISKEPFDYANAESILHARPGNGKGEPAGSIGGQRQFNPYVKALAGPQGLKRARKETAGKSSTFRR